VKRNFGLKTMKSLGKHWATRPCCTAKWRRGPIPTIWLAHLCVFSDGATVDPWGTSVIGSRTTKTEWKSKMKFACFYRDGSLRVGLVDAAAGRRRSIHGRA